MHVRATEIIVHILMPKINFKLFVGPKVILSLLTDWDLNWTASKTKGKLFF